MGWKSGVVLLPGTRLDAGGVLVNMPDGGSTWVAVPKQKDKQEHWPWREEWTEIERHFLTVLYPAYGMRFTAEVLRRSHNSVGSRAAHFGIVGVNATRKRKPTADRRGGVA